MKRSSSHSSRQSNGSSSVSPASDDVRNCHHGQRKKQMNNNNYKRAKLEQPADSDFDKLDQSDPVQARRIQQRRRMVAFGKNTVGYDEYIKKVPKHKRRPRSMKHPTTPDHTLNIPTKRWQGLVRAWRKALHQYDPKDLVDSFAEESMESEDTPPDETLTVQGRQIAEATTKGLPVDFNPCTPSTSSSSPSKSVDDTPISSVGILSGDQAIEADLDACENHQDFLLDEEDSDDDLL